MNAEQAGLMQMQLRHNADELQSYLKDLENWEEEIKEKDKNLSKQKPILKEVRHWFMEGQSGIKEGELTLQEKGWGTMKWSISCHDYAHHLTIVHN